MANTSHKLFYVTEHTGRDMVEVFENLNLTDISTPIDADILEEMLVKSNYNRDKTRFLVRGFRRGFDIDYEGPRRRMDESNNIPLQVGSKDDIWSKIMKEVKTGRVAGPYKQVPFKYYVQSPIGLVPKAGSQKTRLIFPPLI